MADRFIDQMQYPRMKTQASAAVSHNRGLHGDDGATGL